MYKQIGNSIFNILGWIGLSILTLITSASVLVYFFEDDIKEYAIERLNKQLNAEVRVHSIELSLWDKFPYACLNFKGVLIQDAHLNPKLNSSDTLLYAENMYLQFSVWDIWDGNYAVTKIESINGYLNLKINQEGEGNFHFLKPSSDTVKTEFEFDLESVQLINFRYQFQNKKTGQHQNIFVDQIDVQGNFKEAEYDLKAKAKGTINKISTGTIGFIKNRDFETKINLHVENNENFHLSNSELILEEMNFNVEGEIGKDSIQLNLKGKKITLQEFVNSFSGQIFNDIYSYQADGIVNFDFNIQGPYSDLNLKSNFEIENGKIVEPQNNITAKDINLKGNYQFNKNKNELNLKEFQLKIFNGFLQGQANIKNLKNPSISVKAKGNLDLSAIDKIFKLENISKPNGNIKLNVSFKLDQGKNLKKIKGNFEFKDVNFELKKKQIHNLSGKLAIQNDNVALKEFNLLFGSSELAISGAVKNFKKYINKKGNLNLIATVKSDYLKLEDFLFTNEKYTSQTGILPENINLNVDLSCKKFDYATHTIESITFGAKMMNRRLIVSNLKCTAYGGRISGKIDFDNRNSPHSVLELNTQLSNIDIQSVFKDWQNFEQKAILYQNIKGKSNLRAHILLPFDPAKNLIKEKLWAKLDLEIQNGELNNLASMKSITQSMRENKMVNTFLKKHIGPLEQKLLNLKFKKLKNQIIIKDSKVLIPTMSIKSNAFDINVNGEHHFNNQIDYKFDFRFRELKSAATYSEFGKIEDDGTGFRVFLKMYGTVDNPIIEWDKESKKQNLKEEVSQQGETMKSMLKKDFGLFKKDSTIESYEIQKKEEEFMMYDGEFDSKGEPNLIQKDSSQLNPTKKKKKINSIFKNIEKENKNEEKMEFEIEN